MEVSSADADQLDISEGDWVGVESPRGAIEVRAGVERVLPGAVFAPFHYGPRDPDELDPGHGSRSRGGAGAGTAGRNANELTMTVWDPVSKQPTFKTAACRVTRLRAGDGPSRPRPPRPPPPPTTFPHRRRGTHHQRGAADHADLRPGPSQGSGG